VERKESEKREEVTEKWIGMRRGGRRGALIIDYLMFYVPLKNFSLIWRLHHYR
jgi:hypothetical protein